MDPTTTRKLRMLITGVSGLLGGNAFWEFQQDYEVFGTFHSNPPSFRHPNLYSLDLTDHRATSDLMEKVTPDLVLHCAALTNVDLCQSDFDLALRANVQSTQNLVKLSESCKIFIYVSTDAVYPGVQGGYSEDSPLSPPNLYGVSKLKGEEAVQNFRNQFLILRTNIHGHNTRSKLSFSESIFNALNRDQEIHLFQDVWFSPILVNDFCDSLKSLLRLGAQGTFNVASRIPITKLSFGRSLARMLEKSEPKILPISLKDRSLLAPRPLHPGLCVDKIEAFLNRKQPTAEQGLERFLSLMNSEFYRKLKGIQ